jgi:fatty-acyl-CoA synthase
MRVVDLFERSRSVFVLPDGSSCTAPDIAQSGSALADRMRAVLQAGDRVAVKLPNGFAYLQLLVACSVGQLVLVSVNTRYSDAEVADLVERSGARVLIDDPTMLDDYPLVQRIARLASARPDGGDPFLVFTTSGTTNKPKLVRHTQRSIAEHGVHAATGFGYTSDDRALLVMPLCGTFGLASLTAALAGNATVIVVDRIDVPSISTLIERHKITVCNASDDLFHRLLDHGCDLSSIRLGGYARFNSSLDGIVPRAEAAGATLTGLYGMSEVQALFALRSPLLAAEGRSEAGGTPVAAEASFRVVDGELQLRGPSLFEGYLHEGGESINDSLTNAAFDDGWFRTGDSADVDEVAAGGQSFTYHARLNDVLRLGGFLVAPVEIESVLVTHPDVCEAQVVAVDRPTGSRAVAFVISVSGGPIDENSLIDHCSAALARHKVPIRVITLDAFPVTPGANGTKVQLARLREMAQRISDS